MRVPLDLTHFFLLQVSWIRRSDLKILTIGPVVYTRDRRFSPIHRRHADAGEDVWILKVTDLNFDKYLMP